MKDFIDRRITMINRAWAIAIGLSLIVVVGQIPVAADLGWVAGVLLVALAAGGLELGYALWFRYLSEPILDIHRNLVRRLAVRRSGLRPLVTVQRHSSPP